MNFRMLARPMLPALALVLTLSGAVHSSGGSLPLWKVEGGQSTVWLLGSVHFLKASDYPLPAAIEAAYEESDVVVFETDMDALSSPNIQFELIAKGRLPEGEQLQDHLSEKTYAKLMQHAEESGLPAFMLDPLKPSLAATMIVAAELLKLGFDPEQGVDKHFHDRAKADGKKVIPLETVEFQIDLITDFTEEEGELIVKTTLEEFETMSGLFTELVEAWRSGDTAKLDKWLNEVKNEAPAVMERFLTDRNKQWVPKIEAFTKGEQTVLVVVGAGHLVGKESVVDLLNQRGLTPVQQ